MLTRRHVIDEVGPLWRVLVVDRTAGDVDLFRDQLAEDAEGSIHDVATHVTQCARSKLPPSTPCKGVQAIAALALLTFREIKLEIGFLWLGGEPEVPIKIRRAFDDLLFDRPLWPDRTIGPKADLFQRADDPLLDPLLGHALTFIGAPLVTHVGDDARLRRGLVQVTDFADVIAKRFLHADVLFVLQRPHGSEIMRVVWGGDNDTIDLVGHFVEHLAEVLIQLRHVRRRGIGFSVVFFALFRGFFQALCIHVHHCDDVVVQRHCLGIRLPFTVCADLDEVQAFASSILAAQQKIGASECASRQTGAGAEKATA